MDEDKINLDDLEIKDDNEEYFDIYEENKIEEKIKEYKLNRIFEEKDEVNYEEYTTENEDKYSIKKKDKTLKLENFIKSLDDDNKKNNYEDENLIKQLQAIEKKMSEKDNLKKQARKRRDKIKSRKNWPNINSKLGRVVYEYKCKKYFAYHTYDGKLVFNGLIYDNIRDWLKLCFLVNVGK